MCEGHAYTVQASTKLYISCNFNISVWHIFIHSITAGTVVEYFVMVVQITECSYPAQQSLSECVTIVIIMCWDCHRGSTYHIMCYSTTHTHTYVYFLTNDKLIHKCCNFAIARFLFCAVNEYKQYKMVGKIVPSLFMCSCIYMHRFLPLLTT